MHTTKDARVPFPVWGDRVSDERVSAWRALLRAQSAVLKAIDRDLAAAELLPLHWYDVLLELNSAPERQLRMAELGDRVVFSRSRCSRIVDELQQRGLVERVPDPSDGRVTLAQITTAGRRALRRTAPVYLAGIEEHFTSHLGEDERRVVSSALERVARFHDDRRPRRR